MDGLFWSVRQAAAAAAAAAFSCDAAVFPVEVQTLWASKMPRSPQSAASRRRKRDSTIQSVDILNTVMHTFSPAKSHVKASLPLPRRTRSTTLAESRLPRDDFWDVSRSPPAPASEPRRRLSKKLTTPQSSWKSRLRSFTEDTTFGSVVIQSNDEGYDRAIAKDNDGSIDEEGEYDNAGEEEDASDIVDILGKEAYGHDNDIEMLDVQDDKSSEDVSSPINLFSEESDQEVTVAQHNSRSPSMVDDNLPRLQPAEQRERLGIAHSKSAKDTSRSVDEQGHASETSDNSQSPPRSPPHDGSKTKGESASPSGQGAGGNLVDFVNPSPEPTTRAKQRGKASEVAETLSFLSSVGGEGRRITRGALAAAALASSSRSHSIEEQAPGTKKPQAVRSTKIHATRSREKMHDPGDPQSPNGHRETLGIPDDHRESSEDDECNPVESDNDSNGSCASGVHSSEFASSPITSPTKRRRTDAPSQTTQAMLPPHEPVVAVPISGAPAHGTETHQPSRSNSNDDENSSQSSDDELDFLADSPWFQKALKADNQKQSWKAIIRQGRKFARVSQSSSTAELDLIQKPLRSFIALYIGLLEGLKDGRGPSEYEASRCDRLLRKVVKERCRLRDKVYHLSKRGTSFKEQSMALVRAFYKEVIPPMARLLLLCYEVYYMDEKLFLESYEHLGKSLTVLSESCKWVDSIAQCLDSITCLESDLRRALEKLVQSLNYGRLKKPERPKTPEQGTEVVVARKARITSKEWTKDEEMALIRGLKIHPEAAQNRYQSVRSFSLKELKDRHILDIRLKSREMYTAIRPQIREELKTAEGQQKWAWLMSIPNSR
ncbi:uncharacterized protein BO97DRAFT_439264 [Aspergillus homomorphus CBS 101889]|uniref:Uncharacterized protein n=1 Tax=Aspergillus homomorphus (strain CBS 101889) TaxID=1450537 RepID=A0A395IBX7_ASPHC|nr:hypothetical protein BO97DRAFT_439264 [Aspergillus homomorphus CBS 101889]RAL17299.1 hypothetical protein BO97DRAFT_439264 [Aspergillus homomorphus CBS 101889]